MIDDARNQSEESFEQTVDDLPSESSPADAASSTPESTETDTSLFTSEETSPFAADDLRSRAAQAPRTDKQGDVMPQQGDLHPDTPGGE